MIGKSIIDQVKIGLQVSIFLVMQENIVTLLNGMMRHVIK